MDSRKKRLFDEIVKTTNASPKLAAVVLTETLKALRRDGVKVDKMSDEQIVDLFRQVGSGKVAKEAVSDLIVWLSKHEGAEAVQAVDALNLRMIPEEELEKIVDSLIEENQSVLAEKGEEALGVLMGLAMKKVRGRAKAEFVSKLVKRKLKDFQK